ncbi:DUF4214 domain-containing protein [Massilia soli]|uniref:DUF4214 domain-containing protein n=1 Tax=Massilia soli TaxID=2792854 RepID=A0ABS7SSJ6_9BURK|nr:DUF4214 domain-containing protein [Massilia soli]MBZ2208923.1 DUF4214 domain-containing protein [Massilia soli]
MISFAIAQYVDSTAKFADQLALIQRAMALVGKILDRELVSAATANILLKVTIQTDAEVDGAYSAAALPNYSGQFRSSPEGTIPALNGLVNDVAYKVQTGKSALMPWNATTGTGNWFSDTVEGFLYISEGTMADLVARGSAALAETDGTIALLVHEVLHMLGFHGDEDALTEPEGSAWTSPFDQMIELNGLDAWFTGRAAQAIYGDEVPLRPLDSWTNVHHLDVLNLPDGGAQGDAFVHAGSDLMNGLLVDGMRVSDLDVAVLVDLGYRNVRTLVSVDGHTFIPGVGALTLQGTAATNDAAFFAGERSAFSVIKLDGTVTVTAKATPSDVARLNGMETLLFADGKLGTDFIGTAAADVLRGTAASQTLYGGAGDDLLISGGGRDIAVFSGSAAEYLLAADGSTLTVLDTLGRDGRDTLEGVQRLWFADKHLAMDLDGNAGDMYRLYQAAFDRKPDLDGLGFWIGMLDDGMSLADISAAFTTAPEFRDLYGAAPSNSSALTKFYQNVLHREPEQAGFDYWLDVMNNKGGALSAVLMAFSDSPENQAQVIGSIAGGIEYTQFYG